jgi:hypothetical protein
MAKRRDPVPSFALLVAHARWTCVWAWLEHVARPTPEIQDLFSRLFQKVNVAGLFSEVDPLAAVSSNQVNTLLQRWFNPTIGQTRSAPGSAFKTWRRWFGGGRAGPGKRALSPAKRLSPLKSLHESRPFYADPNPDNLQRRFNRLFTDRNYYQKSQGADGPAGNILEWGALAVALVNQHGGWNKFTKLSWNEIKDIPGTSDKLASDPDSFIQRVLHLGRDRYIQILAPAVGPLWPLFLLRFFVKQQRKTNDWDQAFERVRELSQLFLKVDQFDLQKLTASEASDPDRLFIDIHVRRGHLRELPFPFGAAERAVQQDAPGSGVWEPQLIAKVRERLFENGVPWSPPLLLCMRGDVLANADANMNRGRAVRCVTLTDPCPIYATAFVASKDRSKSVSGHEASSADSAGEYSFETVVGQEASWAEGAAEHFGEAFKRVSREEFWDRAFNTNAAKKELFLGYFPLDLPLREKFAPLSRGQIYALKHGGKRLPEEVADDIAYVLPGAVLAGASNLAGQPRMPALLKDLGRLVWRLELFCRNLSASPEEVAALRRQLRVPEDRREGAAVLAKECTKRAAETLTRYFRSVRKAHTSLLPELMIRACNEMAEALNLKKNEREQFESAMQTWGWAVLLEFLPFTSIGYGGEMVFRD